MARHLYNCLASHHTRKPQEGPELIQVFETQADPEGADNSGRLLHSPHLGSKSFPEGETGWHTSSLHQSGDRRAQAHCKEVVR